MNVFGLSHSIYIQFNLIYGPRFSIFKPRRMIGICGVGIDIYCNQYFLWSQATSKKSITVVNILHNIFFVLVPNVFIRAIYHSEVLFFSKVLQNCVLVDLEKLKLYFLRSYSVKENVNRCMWAYAIKYLYSKVYRVNDEILFCFRSGKNKYL